LMCWFDLLLSCDGLHKTELKMYSTTASSWHGAGDTGRGHSTYLLMPLLGQ